MKETFLINSLIVLFGVMIVPVFLMVFYLGKRIFQPDSDKQNLMKIIFFASLGKVVLILIEMFVLLAITTPIKFSSFYSLIFLNIAALFVLIVNWYAFFKIRTIHHENI